MTESLQVLLAGAAGVSAGKFTVVGVAENITFGPHFSAFPKCRKINAFFSSTFTGFLATPNTDRLSNVFARLFYPRKESLE